MSVINSLQRLFYLLKRDKRFEYYDSFCKNIQMSRKEMTSLQNSLIQTLIEHAYEKTDYYHRLFKKHNIDPKEIIDSRTLKKIPNLTKEELRKHGISLVSKDKYGSNLLKVTSGGSTGNQSTIYKSKYYIEKTYGATMRNNTLANWLPWNKVLFLWGAPYENKGLEKSILLKLSFWINRRYIMNAYNYNKEDFLKWTKFIKRKKIKILYGYATILNEFADYILDNKIEINGLTSVVSTSEKLNNRDRISKAFKCKVYDQYGCREILAVGIENDNQEMLIADDNVVLNIDDSGKIIITALHSYGFPLINYEVGDIAESIEENSSTPNKLPFTRIKFLIGRETENFINNQGGTVSASSLSTALSFGDINIKEQQVIQKDYNNFYIKYIPSNNFDLLVYKDTLNKLFRKYFGDDITINTEEVNSIPIEKSGKKLMFKREFQAK